MSLNFRYISYIIIGCLVILICLFMNIEDSNRMYSIMFCTLHILSIYNIWKISDKKIGMFLLFILTFGLFIGGRFYANLMGFNVDIFEMGFFIHYIENQQGRKEIMLFTLLFLFFSTNGYVLSYIKKVKPICNFQISDKLIKVFNLLASFLFPFLFVTILISNITLFKMALSGGYLALYQAQTEAYSGGGNLFKILLHLFFAISIAWGNKTNKIYYILIFTLSSFFSIFIGTRGAFGSLLLVIIWLVAQYKKINLIRLGMFVAGGAVLLLLLFSLSVRSVANDTTVSLFDLIKVFIYSQGISLMVFDFSTFPESYPMLPYIQTIIPGSSFFYAIMTNTVLYGEDIAFASYLSNFINADAFAKGYGLGWTLMSDLYLFSGRTFIGYSILSLIFGWCIGNLECWSQKNKIYLFFQALIIFPFLILPRAGLNTILPLMIYGVIFLFVLYLLSNTFYRLTSEKL